jgi:hypothetical protein
VFFFVQLLEGMQIQQVPSSVSAQTVATLMKAVSSTAAGAVVSSVTLPAAPGVSSTTINFLPQQKLLTGMLQMTYEICFVKLLLLYMKFWCFLNRACCFAIPFVQPA